MELFEQIVQAVNEELGISDLVSQTTDNLISMVDKRIAKNSEGQQQGEIKGVSLFGVKVDVQYTVFVVKTAKDAESVKCLWPGRYSEFHKVLIITLVYIMDEDRFVDFAGTAQHELEHVYQSEIIKKSLISAPKTKKIYKAATNLMKRGGYNEQIVGYSVYYANKFERDAYENSLYRTIMDNPTQDPLEVVKRTTLYNNLRIINNQLENITPYLTQLIENICMDNFGKHFNWWKNLTKKMISNYLTKIGKVIAKAEKDRAGGLVDPNIGIKELPKFKNEEDE